MIFLHIPKAAGTTLHAVIKRQFPHDAIFTIDGANTQKSINEFKNLPEKQKQKIRCLKGHMPFGLHRYLSQPAVYITLLRHPVERMVSHYYYVLGKPRHYLHNEVAARKMSLSDYVSSGMSPELMNGQTRSISGIRELVWENGNEAASADILAMAKGNLDHFAVIGLSERFDESLILCKRLLGWRNVFYVKQNVTGSRPPKREISRETLKVIENHNELDLELYGLAKQRLQQLVREQGASFGAELRAFQTLNKLYAATYRFRSRRW